jgi:aldehyde dehydrogenase (NAD+)
VTAGDNPDGSDKTMHLGEFYMDGRWVKPTEPSFIDVINPATEEAICQIALGGAADVDAAVAAARKAFRTFSTTTREERIALLSRIKDGFEARSGDLARAVSEEMGAPMKFALSSQVASGPNQLGEMIRVLETFAFERPHGSTRIMHEAIGVCGLITPWNWPINQLICKVAPALAAGCTMVLKPSELSPLSALIIAEIMHDADVPAGVFNLVNGDGPTVGQRIASHPDVDMVSFTGSTRAGVLVAQAAAPTVKRVAQELGGKSPNILLPDTDFERSVTLGIARCFGNSGQSCSAATRMLVPRDRHDEVIEIAARVTKTYKTGSPEAGDTMLGPLVSQTQFDKVQALIRAGVDEGAILVAGGPGRPDGLNRGYYVRPTVFAGVENSMRIAREEIFGPVLAVLPYESIEQAIEIANDTPYGLNAYVQGADVARARQVAAALRAGSVHINYPPVDRSAPFGGYKQSGNGREWGEYGLMEFLETKAIVGFGEA